MMKRLTAILLITLLCIAAWPAAYAEETPERETLTYGNYQYVILDDGTAEIVKYQSEDHDDHFGQVALTIPAELDGVPVSSIGPECFKSYYGITSIVIPDGVRRIGSRAFYDLWLLTSVTIPDSVTDVGENPFAECGALIEIIISPDHPVLALKDHLLYAWSEQRLISCLLGYRDEHIDIPDGTRSIGSLAFFYNQCMRTVTIPGSVTTIDDSAFYASFALTSVTFGEGIEHIGSHAFYGCSLQNVTLPDSLKTLGKRAFGENRGLQGISVSPNHPVFETYEGALIERDSHELILYPDQKTEPRFDIPQGIERIGPGAFSNAVHLTEVTIPDSVTSIGDSAFVGCESLQSLTIPRSATELGTGLFHFCNNLSDVVLPDNVTLIGARWFFSCKAMTSFTVPDGVSRIDDGAFGSCDNLVSVTIPASVTYIADNAFAISETINIETNESWLNTSPNLTLTVDPGSYAEQYAIVNELNYVYSDTGVRQ